MRITSSSINLLWIDLLYRLIHSGTPVTPRGQPTLEIVPATLTLTDSLQNIVTVPERNLNYSFMVAEFMWIMAGRNDVNGVAHYNSQIAKFSDNGSTFFGAYGPKIVNQLEHVIDTLERDKDSRQAVINIWRENPPPTNDTPCTLNMQFLVRNFRLHAIVNMRSSDAWLGVPYDLFNFSRVQAYIARKLSYDPGALTVNIGSSHLYEQHFEPAQRIIDRYVLDTAASELPDGRSPPFTVAPPAHMIQRFEEQARRCGEVETGWYEWTEYAHALAYRDHKNLDLGRGHIIQIIREVKKLRK